MAKRNLVTATILAALLVGPAQAFTGNELKMFCDGENTEIASGDVNLGMCFGFVAGVSDGEWAIEQSLPYCLGLGVDYGQMVATVKKYLNDNPDILNNSAAGLVRDALIEAFPCKGEVITPPVGQSTITIRRHIYNS